jgi:hypothetical protein
VNTIKTYKGMHVLTVAQTRCTHIGGYGINNRGTSRGVDMRNRDNWKGVHAHNPSFRDDHDWDKLTYVG